MHAYCSRTVAVRFTCKPKRSLILNIICRMSFNCVLRRDIVWARTTHGQSYDDQTSPRNVRPDHLLNEPYSVVFGILYDTWQ